MDADSRSPYDGMAWFYNKYWGSQFLEKIYPVIEREVLNRIPPEGKVLDLCCGTGQLAARLSESGFRVIGIDISGAMLAFARQNAPAAEFIQADARAFAIPSRVDAAVAVFDSLNHIMSGEDLTEVFKSVYQALTPGGVFLFDLNDDESFTQRWRGSFSIVESDHLLAARSSFDPEARIGRLDATMFRFLENEWRRQDETFLQRAYSPQDISQFLAAVGFTEHVVVKAREMGLDAVGRLVVTAKKPAQA